MAIQAVLFDFDGLIIDTETAWFESFAQLYNEHGHELALEQFSKCIGTSIDAFDPYQNLIELGVGLSREELNSVVKQHYQSRMAGADLRPGVRDYLAHAKEAGLRIAVVSSSHLEWIESYLEQFQLSGYFDALVTADLVEKVKPDPALYLHALKTLGITADEAIAFEDSLNGLKAASLAGIRCFIVPNSVTASLPFETVGYAGRLESMAVMPLPGLLSSLSPTTSA
ncbi:HAD family hydrolase [Paenibacillus kobensis]|uniref:HAD family hydrolase n=1 Tax=Paenibacillus kobensis TaxID=59841 RepID=UPI001FE94F3D|nr:HAD family hydrolase [Paenibacillus kobensis]